MTRISRLVWGGLFFALMFVDAGASFYSNWLEKTRASLRGWEAMEINGKPVIYRVDSHALTADLRPGDEIVQLKGHSTDVFPLLYQDRCDLPAGTGYSLVIRRTGETKELALNTFAFPLSEWIVDVAINLILLIFLVTALTVFLLKPYDQQAWLLALMLGTFVGLFQGFAFQLSGLLLWAVIVARIVGLAFLPIIFHFFLIFPERGPWLQRFPRLELLLYLPFLLTILPFSGLRRIEDYLNIEGLSDLLPAKGLLGVSARIFVIGYLVGGLIAMVGTYRAADADARRKIRLVMAGCSAGILNLLILVLCEFLAVVRTHPQLYDWIRMPLLVTLPLIPLSFAYSIIRHRVIPVSLIIRRGMRYLLVSRGAEILEAVAVGLLVIFLFRTVFNYWQVTGVKAGVIATIVAVLIWNYTRNLHKRFLAPLIDRRFFRQSYDAHQIISELTGALRAVTDLPHLLDLVATKLRTALQTEHVTIFLRDPVTGKYNNQYSCDYRQASAGTITQSHSRQVNRYATMVEQLSQLEKSLEKSGYLRSSRQASDNNESIEIGPADFFKGYDGAAILEEERGALREVDATLLMPLFSKDEMLGIISLGPRLGDLPFSREDKQLLMSVSGPATLAIENARLVEQMVEEARRRQEMEVDHRRKTEELAYARQFQLSMLPQHNLSLDRIDIVGQMRTASEVGGDYYDFIEMLGDRVCIAVGDATGHGMAAGLVVGMVKMGLINGLQNLNGSASVKPLIEDLNRALKRSLSQRGMGMCLGAAILDTSTLKVELFSNGMPAPFHYRAACRSLLPITTPAPPLGFLREVDVRPVAIQLQAGDALLWLSDGFEERLDRKNEVWGSEQVARELERICGEESSAGDIAGRMIEACDRAAGGRSNNDDMTIVVAQVKSR
jgi:sigma-B regulation protein RsbU (phosphoserine phosphatase)